MWKADFLQAHLVLQELDQLRGLVGLGFELDAGKLINRPQADIEVEFLAQSHVQRTVTDTATDRRRQRPLDRHHIVPHRMQGFFWQPQRRLP